MNDNEWRTFFQLAANILGAGAAWAQASKSWCSWTTFPRLSDDAGYWTGGLPSLADIADTNIRDGGVRIQPFSYSELAHLIVPSRFLWESAPGPNYVSGIREQDINALSEQLSAVGIGHRLTNLVLEIKLY